MSVERKTIDVFEIKDATSGDVEAIVATLGVVDRDGDFMAPGSIVDGSKVIMSQYGHGSVIGGQMPVGKGVINVVGNKAIFRGRLFMDTTAGVETFKTLKAMGGDQEWSFGFLTDDERPPTPEQKSMGARRAVYKTTSFEVSPVFLGGGLNTQTLSVKQADGDPGEPAVETPAIPEPVVESVDDAEAQRIAKEAEAKAAQILADASAEFARLQRNMRRFA